MFFPAYERHGADPDLTERAKKLGVYQYEPQALLVEVDYDKRLHDTSRLNAKDFEIYKLRSSEGFKWEI